MVNHVSRLYLAILTSIILVHVVVLLVLEGASTAVRIVAWDDIDQETLERPSRRPIPDQIQICKIFESSSLPACLPASLPQIPGYTDQPEQSFRATTMNMNDQ